jgi:hypothetical protein
MQITSVTAENKAEKKRVNLTEKIIIREYTPCKEKPTKSHSLEVKLKVLSQFDRSVHITDIQRAT